MIPNSNVTRRRHMAIKFLPEGLPIEGGILHSNPCQCIHSLRCLGTADTGNGGAG